MCRGNSILDERLVLGLGESSHQVVEVWGCAVSAFVPAENSGALTVEVLVYVAAQFIV